MLLEQIERGFRSYLNEHWKLSDIAPFLLVYIRLLLLFQNELSEVEKEVVLERQRQLRGEKFKHHYFDELKKVSRIEMDRFIHNNQSTTRKAMLNRLLYCALLDSEESDFFYLTEPIFEFAQNMQVQPNQLLEILKSEFIEFKI